MVGAAGTRHLAHCRFGLDAVVSADAHETPALLDAAGDLDARPQARTEGRRALVATLVFAGLRLGEACALRWREVDLATGRLVVGESKTDAGMREVRLLPVLRDELTSHRLDADGGAHDLLFPTSSGSLRDKDNVRERVIRPVVRRADELLAARGELPLPVGVTAHKLRHTFASLLVASGEDPAYVMSQLGHADPGFTLRVYAHVMRRDEGALERLRELIEGRFWAPMGTGGLPTAPRRVRARLARERRKPRKRGFQRMGAAGFEPATSRV